MELRPGYKQTEVGVIPEEWDVRSLGDVCVKVQDGTHFSPTIRGGKYLYVTSKNIGLGTLDINDAPHIDEAQHRAIYRRCDPKRGDILLTKDGANTGNAALNTLDEEFSLLSSVVFLRFDPEIHHASYFLQHILSHDGQKRIKDEMSGNAITRLTLAKINRLKYPICALPEQRAIATALSDVDALLDALDRLIAKKRDLKQAAMQQLLTGQTRLPGFSGEWEVKRLGNLCTLKSGEGITAKRIDDISPFPCYGGNGLRGFTTRFTHEGDYCLIGRVGALCGNLLKVTGQFFASEHAIVATAFEDVNVDWLTLALGTLNLNRRAESSAQPVLTVSKLLPLEVLAPTTKDEQTAIAAVLSDMDAEIAALEARRTKTRDLKLAMMQDLLTGKTRLI